MLSFTNEDSVVHISKVGQFVLHKRHFSQMCFLTEPETHMVTSGIKPKCIR